MTTSGPVKLLPRNVAALRQRTNGPVNGPVPVPSVAGNPVSTRLESGVGNCFPGLEFDLRNLERRFFPFLEVDITDATITVVGVDAPGVAAALAAGKIDATGAANYQRIGNDALQRRFWQVSSLRGTFGALGVRQLVIATLGQSANDDPPDAWTAVRLLTEGTAVSLALRRGTTSLQLQGARQAYLDKQGALSAMFTPGELTQSLCSPWTHDFRDCGCFYWASNHPDIAQPPLPTSGTPGAEFNIDVPWERSDRTLGVVPTAASIDSPSELDHYEINARWQELNFVVEGREIIGSYAVSAPTAKPFASQQQLITQLRYAAGVELAVMQAYLASAYSLRETGANATITDDITAARAEFMRIAIGEMRHLRVVNTVLASIAQRTSSAFVPALQVALRLPGDAQPWQPQAATPAAITAYITLEAPSKGVDGLYARILATLERDGTNEEQQSIRSVIAEGEDHFQTFEFIQEWLGRHQPAEYLRSLTLTRPPAGNAAHVSLQTTYKSILELLHDGYSQGLPAGANEINQARTTMVKPPNSLDAAAQAVADAGFLVVFDALGDPRFVPIDTPA